MRVAILSYAYAPSLGGIESVSRLVADGLAERGHEIVVITATEGVSDDEFRVVRRPSRAVLVSALRSADAVIESNTALSLSWPLALRLVRCPWIVVSHTPIARTDGRVAVRDRVKQMMLPSGRYAVSEYLASEISRRAMRTLPNPYDDAVFRPVAVPRRGTKDLLFVGRLTRAKGADVLLNALAVLASDDDEWTLTIVGAGEAFDSLVAQVRELGLVERVCFLGRLEGKRLARVMSAHRVLVVPSRRHPAEAFGLVAVEAIATGAVVVASEVGGLPEAVGGSGYLVEPESVDGLVKTLREVAGDPGGLDSVLTGPEATRSNTVAAVAEAYEKALVAEGLSLAASR